MINAMIRRSLIFLTLITAISFLFSCEERKLPPEVNAVSPFSEGRAAFRSGDQWGYLNEKLEIVIPAQFAQAGPFSSGRAAVRLVNKWGHIDRSGKFLQTPHYTGAGAFHEGMSPVREGQAWGYADAGGSLRIEPQFEEAEPFYEGLAAVCLGHRWGFVDKKGRFRINPLYRDAGHFSENLAPVHTEALDNGWGYIDPRGRFAIPPRFDDAKPFAEGLAPVLIDTVWGYIDKKGKVAINPRYEEAEPFVRGLARVKVKGKWGYIDHRGQSVIAPRFDEARDFYQDYALAAGEGRSGFINRKGIIVLEVPAIAGAVAVAAPKAKPGADNYNVIITLNDYREKKPVPDAEVRMWGIRGMTPVKGKTDTAGRFQFQIENWDLENMSGIYVQRNGYWENIKKWDEAQRKGGEIRFDLTTFDRSAPFPELEEARLTPEKSVEEYDVLTENAAFTQYKKSSATLRLKPRANGWRITGYRIQQGMVYIKSSGPEFRDLDLGSKFKPDMPVYAVIETDYGDLCGFVPLKIRIRENPDVPKVPATKESPSFKFDESVPMLKNHTGGIKLPFFPVQGFWENDKFTLIAGIQADWSDGDLYTPKKILNDMKKGFGDVKKARQFLKEHGGVFQRMPKADTVDASLGFAMYLEFQNDENGRLRLIGGKGIIFGSGSVTVTEQFVIVVVPVFISGTVGATLSVEFAYESGMDSVGDIFASAEITLAPFVEIEAGVGIKGVLSLSVAGKGTVPISFKPKTGDFKVDLTLGAEFRAVAFVIFTYSVTIAEKTWRVYPRSGSRRMAFKGKKPGSPFSMASYKMAPRSKKPSLWMGDKNPPPALGPVTEQVLKSNILEGSEPRLVRFGNQEALLWIDDGKSREDNNRAVLMYAVRRVGGKFGDPKPVHEDGTNDVAFSAVAHKDDLWVAWQNTTKVFKKGEKVNLEEMCRNSAVYVGYCGGGDFKGITRIDDSKLGYVGRPQLASDGKNLGLIYCGNSRSNYFGTEGENWVFAYQYSWGKWSGTQIYSTIKPIIGLAAAMDGSETKAALILDNDRRLETVDDRILVIAGKGRDQTIVDKPEVIGHPRFAQYRGNTALFWYCKSNIRFYTRAFSFGRGEFKDVFPSPQLALSDDYDLLMNPDGAVKAVLWINSDQKLNSEAYAGFYNESTDDWGNPVPLTKSGKRVEAPQGYIDRDGSAVLVYRRLEYDTSRKEYQRSSSDLCVANVAASMDLALADGALQGDFAPQMSGKNYGFSLAVANYGTLPCDGIVLDVMGPDGRVVNTLRFTNKLAPGQSVLLRGEYPVPRGDLMKHDFSVRVSPKNGRDIGTSPKTAACTVGVPDIRISKVFIYRKKGYRISRITVNNANGNKLSWVDVTMDIKSGNDWKRWYGEDWGNFEPLESKTKEISEPVREDDPLFLAERRYSVEVRGQTGATKKKKGAALASDRTLGSEINPFRLNPFTPSIQKAEGESDGIIRVTVPVLNNHPADRSGTLRIDLKDENDRTVDSRSFGIRLGPLQSGSYTTAFAVKGDPRRYRVAASIERTSLKGTRKRLSLWMKKIAPDRDEASVTPSR